MSYNNKIPDWSLQVTEQLIQQPTQHSISPLPSTAIEIHSNEKDEQFQDYIDRHFTTNDAKILKNRLSETPSKGTTLRNSYAKEDLDLEKNNTDNNVWWTTKDDEDGFYSIGGLLFLFGFIFPPCWWIGSFWPKNVKEKGGKMADRWQKLNRIMSIGFSTILIILIIIFVVLYVKK